MNALDLFKGRKAKVMTDLKVEIELEIKELKEVPCSRQITADTRENDWYGDSAHWTEYELFFVNGGSKRYHSISGIKIVE